MQHATMFYDGDCGLCGRLVAWARPRVRPGAVTFVDNTSTEGRSRLLVLGMLERSYDTLVADVEGRILTESAATVALARRLRWPHRFWMAIGLVPRPLRDWGYRQVAKRRKGTCGTPARG